jgi:GDP-mannose 6-dehydrogenase
MKVSVFGLGYVGMVGAVCLARDGISVVGVDVNPDKVAMVTHGRAPLVEPGLQDLLEWAVKSGRLAATRSAYDAVNLTNVSFVAVGTPSQPDGSLDVSLVLKVCDQIGAAVAAKGRQHLVVIRSTVSPGTTGRCREILRKHSKKSLISIAFNPEFLREGTAIKDYDTPAYTIIGTSDPQAEQILREIYANVRASIIVTTPRVAETIKLVANAWHATKVAFANEIGRLGNTLQFDAGEVMNLLIQDSKLNTSSAYLRPGFAFGGSCLPKDLRALTYVARTENLELPLLSSLVPSNQAHINAALAEILATEKRRLGLVGLAFKPGTDDLRESPALELAERLIGKGRDLRIFDPAVCEANLIGANRRFMESKLPHLSRLLVSSAAELLEHAELIVVTQHNAFIEEAIAKSARHIPTKHLCCSNIRSFPLLSNNQKLGSIQTAVVPQASGAMFNIT